MEKVKIKPNGPEVLEKIELLRTAREVLSSSELHPELMQALGLGDFTRDVHTEVFVLDLKPFASIYLSKIATLGGEVQDVIAGYYRAVGMSVPKDPDSMYQMLSHYEGLLHCLVQDEQADLYERTAHLRRAFLHEQILPWIPFYLTALGDSYEFLALFSESLMEFFRFEVEDLNVEVGTLMPLVLAEREFLKATGGPDEMLLDVKALVSPFPSGLILTQKDLFRCARESDAVTRVGTKSFMLETLLGQKPKEVLEWLLNEVKRQRRNWNSLEEEFAKVAESWVCATEHTQRYLEMFLSTL